MWDGDIESDERHTPGGLVMRSSGLWGDGRVRYMIHDRFNQQTIFQRLQNMLHIFTVRQLQQ
jgi:hypothetical protein